MNLARSWTIAHLEFRTSLRRPMFWVLLFLLALVTWGLGQGNLTISSGDTSVGGDKLWINSQFNLSLVSVFLSFLLYCFFVAVMAGLSIIQDDEQRVSELLFSTPLRASEYVAGKLTGLAMTFGAVITFHLLAMIVFFQFLPIDDPEEIRGPFSLWAYVLPMILFTIPVVVFFGATAFAIGERWRRPILVFVLPTALFLATVFFLWNWSPPWLDPRINTVLMVLDPSGFRWLNETWLKVDRGVEFYNTQPLGLDWVFWLNRGWQLLIAGLAVIPAVRHSARAVAGDLPPSRLARRLTRQLEEPTQPVAAVAAVATRALGSLAMTSRPPGLIKSVVNVARAELRELKNQPGLYLFVPLILLQVVGGSLFAVGAFGTPLLITSGMIAVGTKNVLAVLVCLLLLFYTVESLTREKRTGIDSIVYATPVSTTALLFGKSIANAALGAVILLGGFLGGAITILIQAKAPLEIKPFVLIWGFLLAPTFLLWSSFVTCVLALVRERYTTYGICLGALAATGYFQFRGTMNWVFNWGVWGAVPWSDMGALELDRLPILLNRVLAIGASIFFIALAVKLFGRQDSDPSQIIRRLHPRSLMNGVFKMAPYALLPVVAGAALALQVRHGNGGEIAEKHQKDYWRKNLATYRDLQLPAVSALDVDLELEPADSSFHAKGSYKMVNHLARPIDRIPFTASSEWSNLSWTFDGTKIEASDSKSWRRNPGARRDSRERLGPDDAIVVSRDDTVNETHGVTTEEGEPETPRDLERPSAPWLEDRSGLWVFHFDPPLQPGAVVEIGFEHSGQNPKGASKNGGGAGQFILPAGVVLHTFGPSFLPVPGYFESIGVDEDNQYETQEFDDELYRTVLEPALGSAKPFTTRVRASAPEEYLINSVGAMTSEEVADGRRTVVWESDYPVKLLNVVAGRWAVKRASGTAVFYHPEHTYNIDEISGALVAAKKYYSEWFYPYPWQELKLSEFPALANYAQGFPTNITFSEGIGFLTKSDPRSNAAFMVTAHESAHQWWGNLLTPGKGPGGNILSEGMSHYSTILLIEQVKGIQERIEFCKLIENRYGDNRQVDSERPLIKIDGSRAGDTTVTYDKGGWVMWMLHNLMGRENALAGLQEFQRRFIPGPDHPLMEDLVETLEPFAPDKAAFREFVNQWVFDVVVPEYRLLEPKVEAKGEGQSEGRWLASVRVENAGETRMPVEVAAIAGERFPEEEEVDKGSSKKNGAIGMSKYREHRQTIVLGKGESVVVRIETNFEPERFVVDPDALVLQLKRKSAVAEIP